MKLVELHIKGDKMRIMAEGVTGKGTELFTENLAKEIGKIIERHHGHHTNSVHEHHHDHVHN